MTYAEVITRLEEIEADLARLDSEETHPAEAYFRDKREWEYQWAKTYMETEGTVAERQNKTTLQLWQSPAYKALVNSEAAYEGAKARSRTLETRASIGQSLLRAMTREAPQTGEQPQRSGAHGSRATPHRSAA